MYVNWVEPTNNDAARAIRKVVLVCKRSFGTQSPAGSAFVSRLMMVSGTARRRSIRLLDRLTNACRAAMNNQLAPLLSPA
jgi:transposase